MPQRIALITDSTCDIPASWREQYDIRVVPLTIVFGDRQYLDGVDMNACQTLIRPVWTSSDWPFR